MTTPLARLRRAALLDVQLAAVTSADLRWVLEHVDQLEKALTAHHVPGRITTEFLPAAVSMLRLVPARSPHRAERGNDPDQGGAA